MKESRSVKKIIEKIKNSPLYSQFMTLLSFLVTFILTRAVTHLQRAHILPNQTGALHIHHLVLGIFLLLGSGYAAIAFGHNEKIRIRSAIAFGIGAALTIDEFALWLFLKDVYWARQGRDSIDAVIIAVALLLISLVLSETHDRRQKKRLTRKNRRV